MLSKAIQIASTAHINQVDRGGEPYILHPIRVMNDVCSDDCELRQIAVMHDVLEDSEYTIDNLRNEGFSLDVITALDLLNHDKDNDTYNEYIEKVASNYNAILVKMADLRDNSKITRLKGVSQKDLDRMAKYHKSYMYLKDQKNNFIF